MSVTRITVRRALPLPKTFVTIKGNVIKTIMTPTQRAAFCQNTRVGGTSDPDIMFAWTLQKGTKK